jgi:hypothetical protein
MCGWEQRISLEKKNGGKGKAIRNGILIRK